MRARRRLHGNASGSLLVMTLWLITILSVLAIAIGRYLSIDVRLAKYTLAREQAKTLARSGVYLAMQRLMRDATPGEAAYEPYDWLGDEWANGASPDADDPGAWVVQLQADGNGPSRVSGSVTIRLSDEERRLDVNTAPAPVLTALLLRLNGTPELADALIHYRDPAEEAPVDEPPYYPKNAPVRAIEELVAIPGLRAVFPRLQPLVTAAQGAVSPQAVNINTVEPDVLIALCGDPAIVETLVANRPGREGVWGTSDDCAATEMSQAATQLASVACGFSGDTAPLVSHLSLPTASFTISSSTFRVQVEARVEPDQVTHRIEAVVRRTGCGSGAPDPCIIEWKDG